MGRFTWKALDGTYQIGDHTGVKRTICYDENFKNPFVIYEGAAINKLGQYEDMEEQGRLIILSIEDIHPCRNCNAGWGSFSSNGWHSCKDTCEMLKQYNKKYNKYE